MKIKYNKETYKDVPGYEGQYQVSVRGNVRSLDRLGSDGRKLKGQMLRPGLKSTGYSVVSLCRDGVMKSFNVHTLVAFTFLGVCPEGMNIDHFDENKANNKLCNLSYMLIGDNMYRSKKNMTSTHRGVHWNKADKKWKVQLTIDGKRIYLGSFDTELEAVEVIKEYKNK